LNSRLKKIAKASIPGAWQDTVKTNARKIRHFGIQHYCNICKSGIRAWKPLGLDLPVIREKKIIGAGRRNTLCPVCFSSDRTRLLYWFLSEKIKVFGHPLYLLHVAPELPLRKIFEQDKVLDYLTADLMQEDVMVKMDLTDIQYPDATFDAILCNHVLEHIPDDRRAMKELYRVLKPGSWAILQVPISAVLDQTFEDPAVVKPKDRENVFGQLDHVRIYGADYTHRLKSAGFRVDIYDWTEDPDIRKYKNHDKLGLNPDEKIFLCKRP